MKRTKTSKAWMREHVNDAFVKRANAEGLRSRAAFKLIEIADRDRLFKPGMTVVDLGSAPGSWSKVAAQRVGSAGLVIAIDLLDMAPIAGVSFVRGDLALAQTRQQIGLLLGARAPDLVLCDMAPNISGVAGVDQARASRLALTALEFSAQHLKPGGALLVKAFQGSALDELREAMNKLFQEFRVRKPAASRGRSNEVYLLGKGRRDRRGSEPRGSSEA